MVITSDILNLYHEWPQRGKIMRRYTTGLSMDTIQVKQFSYFDSGHLANLHVICRVTYICRSIDFHSLKLTTIYLHYNNY